MSLNGFIWFEVNGNTYHCTREADHILVEHRPAHRFDWSDPVEIWLPLDYFTNHTVEDFCQKVESREPFLSTPINRQEMYDKLVASGYLPGE